MKKTASEFVRRYAEDIVAPILAVLLSFLVGAIILLVSGYNPVDAYSALLTGVFGDIASIGDMLSRATPVIFTALAVAITLKCKIFNIGAEGQLLLGALASAYVGYSIKGLPMLVHLPITILAAMVAGGLWAAIPGILKAYRGVNEIITTIMLNYIASSLVLYSIDVLKNGTTLQTPRIQPSAVLFRISDFIPVFNGSNLNIGFLIAILTCFIIAFLLNNTATGYEIKAIGFNSLAAESCGISIRKNIILAMIISGMLAGLAGCERVLGVHLSLIAGISPGYGFEGIAASLLANNNPIGIIFSGMLFGALSSGSLSMNINANVPQDITVIIQALIIFFITARSAIGYLTRRAGEVGTNG